MGGKDVPHFLRLDNQGNIVVSKQYSDPAYTVEHVADIAALSYNGGNYYYITCLARQTGHDYIKILCVDDNGVIRAQKVFGDATKKYQFYPMSSAIRQDATTTRLYICGYTTNNASGISTALPATPTRMDDKQAFVAWVDIDVNSPNYMNIINVTARDWNNPATSLGFDFDMAQRVIIRNNANQDIYVTGSVCGKNYTANNKTYPKSATMNWAMDPNFAFIADRPFVRYGGIDAPDAVAKEWGQDLVQTGDRIFVMVNSGDYGEYGTGGFVPPPHLLDWCYINEVDPVTYVPNPNRYMLGEGGHMIAQGFSTGGTQATLAIMAIEQTPICIPHPEAAKWNVNAVLYNVDLNSPGSANMVYYTNLTGTGDPSLVSNAYYNLSPDLMNIEYNPTFCAYAGNGYVLNAPKYKNGRLNLKYVNPANSTYKLDDTGCGYNDSCYIRWVTDQDITNIGGFVAGVSMSPPIKSSSVASNYANFPTPSPCVDANGNPDHKHGSTELPKLQAKYAQTLAYPNPATDQLRISLAQNIAADSKVDVVLQDLQGRLIARLFAGTAEGLNKNNVLMLPQLASGMYILDVTNDNKNILRQKLSIQQ